MSKALQRKDMSVQEAMEATEYATGGVQYRVSQNSGPEINTQNKSHHKLDIFL